MAAGGDIRVRVIAARQASPVNSLAIPIIAGSAPDSSARDYNLIAQVIAGRIRQNGSTAWIQPALMGGDGARTSGA